MDTPVDDQQTPQRKGRGNAILTYERVEELNLGIQATHMSLLALTQEVRSSEAERGKTIDDFEARLRALERTVVSLTASRGVGTWLFQAMWPMAGVIIALLTYLNNQS